MIAGWWFQRFFIFTPIPGEDEPILTSIFFRWVGSTTNQIGMRLDWVFGFCFSRKFSAGG